MSRGLLSLSAVILLSVGACTNDGGGSSDAATDTGAADTGTADTGAADAHPDEAAAPDAGCGPGASLYYQVAGCDARPACLGDGQDACLGTYCGCDGVTFTDGCDYSTRPFVHRGACGGTGEGGADSDARPTDACVLGSDCDSGQGWDASACACVPRPTPDGSSSEG